MKSKNSKRYYVISSKRENTYEFIKSNIGSNSNIITDKLSLAKIFDDNKKALKFISNLSKELRVNRSWFTLEVQLNNNTVIVKNEKIKEEMLNSIGIDDIENINKNIKHFEIKDKNSNSTNEILNYYDTFLNDISTKRENLIEKKSELENKRDLIEKKIVDLNHYIEFYTLNASMGYCAYKELHDIFNERRNIKNEINKINIILKAFDNTTDFNKLYSDLNKVNNQKYSPRVLFDLFN